MSTLDVLKAAARRWELLVVLAILGATAGYLIGPPKDRASETEYEASHTLASVDPLLTPSRMALLVPHQDVSGPVAEEYGYEDTFELLDDVLVEPNDPIQTLKISTSQPGSARAEGIVDGLATNVVAYLTQADMDDQATELTEVEAELTTIDVQRTPLATKVNDGTASTSEQSEYEALTAVRNQLLVEQRDLQQEPDPRAETLLSGTAREVQVGGFNTPLNTPLMMLIGLLLGVGLGVGLAVMLDHLDSKVRTVGDVVEAFSIPVIGQVPPLPRQYRGTYDIITYEKPNSPSSESHRSLRTRLTAFSESVGRSALGSDIDENPIRRASGWGQGGSVFLITSASIGDGKSTTVANLAAAFADTGRNVIVVAGDLRSPTIHRYLDVPDDAPGIGDDMGNMGIDEVERLLQPTSLPNVRLLSHGDLVNNPGELIAAKLPALVAARELADVVLIDSPPVLAANDVPELLPAVDGVVIVSQIGLTRIQVAKSSSALLESLAAPVVGVVVLGASDDAAIYGYFGSPARGRETPVRAHARIVRYPDDGDASTRDQRSDDDLSTADLDAEDDELLGSHNGFTESDQTEGGYGGDGAQDVPSADDDGPGSDRRPPDDDEMADPTSDGSWSSWRTR